jgi:para-nitrobenzyl esterase
MRKVVAGLVVAFAIAALARLGADAAFPDQVKVTGGAVKGAVADGVLSFKGIPFAAAPIGDLRWRPPQPVVPWTGVKDATAYGHDCAQKPVSIDAAPLGTEPSEDCLVLNVWRPADKTSGALPVMVWIYGGGFVNGGSSPAVYDGSQFARQGVVLVSFNYRIGRFGFFAHPALSQEHPGEPLGNYGYMDQIAALKWVQANIAQFGGDPKSVTLFGESAGGGSVLAMLTSPAAKGLVHRAIVESGGGRSGLGAPRKLHEDLPNSPSAESVGVAFAKTVGIECTDAAALAALRKLSTEQVVGGLNFMTMMGGAQTFAGPFIDGQIVVETVGDAFAAGHNARVPIMAGANSLDIGFSFAKTMDEVMKPFGPDAEKALAAYDPGKTGNVQAVGYQVAMDRIMIEPARYTAKTFAAQGQPSYLYRFSYVAESIRAKTPGAPHAAEIPYVFDTVKAKYGVALTAADEATARAANAYWANFAKTGNPNGAGLEKWPAYKPDTNMLLDFTADGPKAVADPWQTRMDLTEAAATRH